MISQKDNFSAFGAQFQTKCLHAILIDQSFFEKVYDILLNEYFDQRQHSHIHKMILEYYETYKMVPASDIIEIGIRSIKDDMLREECFIVINEIKKSQTKDLTYVKDKVFEFCKNQKMKKALLSSVDYLEQGKFEDIYRTIKDALNAGENSEIGHNYFEHFDRRLLSMQRSSISTGWPVIDRVLNGGYGKGELAVMLAGTSVGKCVGEDTEIEIEYEDLGLVVNDKLTLWFKPWDKIKIDEMNEITAFEAFKIIEIAGTAVGKIM